MRDAGSRTKIFTPEMSAVLQHMRNLRCEILVLLKPQTNIKLKDARWMVNKLYSLKSI